MAVIMSSASSALQCYIGPFIWECDTQNVKIAPNQTFYKFLKLTHFLIFIYLFILPPVLSSFSEPENKVNMSMVIYLFIYFCFSFL